MAKPKQNCNEPTINDNFETKQTNQSVEQCKYPKVMQEIFDYLDCNPMSIIGQRMYYKPTKQLSNNRDLTQLYGKLETLDFETSNTSSIHHAKVVKGLLYLSMNGLDECHNLVTPFSWSSYTSFAGKPIYNSPSHQNACYVHALTHRREGQFVGEFGTGWNNSAYWFGQTGYHNIIFPLIAKYAYDIIYNDKLKKSQYQKDKQITKFSQSILILDNQNNNNNNKQQQQFQLEWNPHSFLNLCEKAVKQKDDTLMAFCQDIANKEWRLLTQHCYDFVINSNKL